MSANIKDIRKRTGLSQSAFATRTGIPVRTLQQWEQERSTPPAYVVSLVEDALFPRENMPFIRENYCIPQKTSWKICIPAPFKNCHLIYPIQQRKVRALIDALETNPQVKRALVFGSSITEQCHMGSDVDIYVETTDNVNPLSSASETFDFEYDLWTNHTADERLRNEIVRKGVVVYG